MSPPGDEEPVERHDRKAPGLCSGTLELVEALTVHDRPPDTLRRFDVHVLRHSASARMSSAGWTLKAVQQVLGHRSIAFTLPVYGHLLNEDLDAFAGALDITSRGTAGVQTLR